MEYYFEGISSLKPIHVYLSFLGDDDGTSRFIHLLSAALKLEGFRISGDDKTCETAGSNLPPHLVEAIKESWICIVVFSKNYASSVWCLEELSQIATRIIRFWAEQASFHQPCHHVDPFFDEEKLEEDADRVKKWRIAMKQRAHVENPWDVPDRIIPIFYDVDTSFPKNKLLGWQAIKVNEGGLSDLSKVSKWKKAMEEVTNLGGCWDLRNDSIQEIVREVKKTREKIFYGTFSFVGMQSRVEEVEKLLDLGSDDVARVVGICGMSGLGKSSVATVLYMKIFHHFDAFCFLPNVSRRLKHGDISLQELLHRDLETENLEIKDILSEERLPCKRLRNHKFLIALDGVDHAQDIEELKLDKKLDCFGGGSRIIITTRDEQVLQKLEVDAIHIPELLTKDEAFHLFRSQAFQRRYPEGDHKEMAYRVLEYANGLPLAIENLGSFLYQKSDIEWRSFLDREEIIPPYQIIMVLRKCSDELDNMHKEIFLDVACFFTGKDINCVKEILHDCGFSVEIGIKLLIEKSLMTISNQRIQMHNMLRVLGQEIIRQESLTWRRGRSRLFLFSDIKSAMEREFGGAAEKVEAIVLDLEASEGATLRIDKLSIMNNLRLLIFRNVNCSGTLNNLSSKLRHVSWHQYPFTCLPSNFQSDTLVQLIMPDSNLTEVWKDKMMLPGLRKMILCGSKNLIKIPDFEGVPNLERLDLEGCTGLLQLHPSIAILSKLKFLNLKNCSNLIGIPNSLFALNSLKVLNLASCSKFAHCLKFSPWKSLIEVKLLSIWYSPFLDKLLYFFLFVLPEEKNYHQFVVCCFIYLMCKYIHKA